MSINDVKAKIKEKLLENKPIAIFIIGKINNDNKKRIDMFFNNIKRYHKGKSK